MSVRDFMTSNVVTTTPNASLKDVAHTLVDHGISGMPVCDDAGTVVGVISECDILYKERGSTERRGGVLGWLLDSTPEWELEKARARTAGEAMSAPAVTVMPSRSASAAARLMIERGIKRLPVVTMDGRLVGIVTRTDLIRAFVRPDDAIAADIRDDVLGRVLWVSPGRVEVAVTDGEVDLTGQLDTESDVELLEALAARIPGVVTVRSTVSSARPEGVPIAR